MKYLVFVSLFTISTLMLFSIKNVSAATCTFSGDTAYCSDPNTGKTTTYNQYGDNIYGSDGSSATIYHDPVSGMGSGLPSVSTAGVDMDSPEMKEAQAKYDEACDYEGFNGGAQATNCRNAVVEWLQALSNAPKISSSRDSASEENDYSDYSDTRDDDTDELIKDLFSIINNTNGNTQSEDLCVSRGVLNSHQVGNGCTCNNGYINSNSSCIPLTIQSCELIYGKGAIPNEGTSLCKCGTGYTLNSTKNSCIPTFNSANNSETKSSSLQQPETAIKKMSVDFEVKPEDILPINETGKINTEATLRLCPSTECSKVESYPKGTVVEIIGKYKSDTWFKVNVINSKAGWMHQSLVDESIIEKDNTSVPIRITRAEYEEKFGVPVPAEVQNEVKTEKVSLWRKILNWFGL